MAEETSKNTPNTVDSDNLLSVNQFIEMMNEDIPPGTMNDEGHLVAKAPKEVSAILAKLFPPQRWLLDESAVVSFSEPPQLSEEEIATLNAFASKVANNDCKIISADGCRSCFMGIKNLGHGCYRETWGNHVNTTCGWQCWQCAVEVECTPVDN